MTATLAPQNIGAVKTALKAILLGPEYTDMLAQLAREFGDGIALPPLEAAFTADKVTLPAYPCVELIGDQTKSPDDSEAAESHHRVEAWFWQCGDDEETITAQVERYVLALRRVLKNGSLMPYVGNFPILFPNEAYAPVGRGKGTPQAFLKYGILEVLIGTVEN